MRAIWKNVVTSSRGCVTALTALLFVLGFGLTWTAASGQTIPKVVVSQSRLITNYQAGGISGGDPAGTTMAVNQQGMLLFGNTYGGNLYELNPATGVLTVLGTPGNVAGVTVDANNNLYFTNQYGDQITKLPYRNGGYTYPSSLSNLPACTGNDTSACYVPGTTFGADGYYFQVNSLVYDSANDLFVALNNQNQAPNSIIYCSAACTTGTGSGSIIFQEPTAASGQPQLILGSMSADAQGNLYFTDSAANSSGITVSHLYELPLTAPGVFAATPVVLYTNTPATPGSNQVDAVAVANNTVYFATTYDGIFAMPIVGGAANPAMMYAVSTQGAKEMATDGKGNFYVDTYVGSSDTITSVAIGSVTSPINAGSGNDGVAITAPNVTTILNDGNCTSTGVTFTSSNADFTASTTGTCNTVLGNFSSFTTNLQFTPTTGGVETTTLTGTDTVGGTGTASATGTGVSTTVDTPTFNPPAGTYTSIQTVAINDGTANASIYYTTDGTTPSPASTLYTGPITVASSETINAIATYSGLTNSAVATAPYTINLAPAATPTFAPAPGTYTSTQSVTISSSTGTSIYYTLDNSTPTTSSTLYTGAITVSASETIKAIATGGGYSTSAVGTGTYTIAPAGLAAPKVIFNQTNGSIGPLTGGGALSGENPAGTSGAVNQQGNFIVSNTYGGKVFLFNGPANTATTLGSFSNVGPVAVDNANNLFIAQIGGTSITKIPYAAGTYAVVNPSGSTPLCTGTDTVECTLPFSTASTFTSSISGVVSMTMDASGNLFYATMGVNPYSSAPATPSYNAIYECSAACIYSTTTAPALLYTEPVGTGGTLTLGGIAVGPHGDVFFTDAFEVTGGSQENSGSNLKELTYTAGAYSTTPITLATLPQPTPGNYDDEIDTVATDAAGNVYFGAQNEGVYAFPSTAGVVNTAAEYAYSTGGAKTMALDSHGDVYSVTYNNGDVAVFTAVNNLTVPQAAVGGTATTATDVTVILNDGGCGTPETITYAATEGGVATNEFSGMTTGTCQSLGFTSGSQFAASVSFAPTASGPRTATLTATDSNGNSGSATVTGTAVSTVATQTITFTAPASPVLYSAQTIPLVATASSGLPVTFTVSSGPGTVSGSTLTVTGVGTIVVTATQPGNATYSAATPVSQSIVVNQGTNTITFPAPTSPVSYSGQTITLSATDSAGLPITYSVTSGPGTVSGNTLTVTGVGTIVIAASSSGTTDYSAATPVSQSIVVNQGTNTITFPAPASPVSYSAQTIALTATASSGLPVTYTITSGPGTISGSNLTVTGVGTIVVAANQAGNTDYAAATTVSQSIVVNQGTQTITFTAASPVTYGVSPITLSATSSSGLAVTFSVTSGPGTISGNTLTVTGAGTIVVAANQAGNPDYAAAATVSQSIVVNPEPQTITFTAPASPVTFSGQTIPLTATASSGLAVTFSVTSGPGTISGNSLTVTGAGTIVVAANQAGNANFAPAPAVTQSIVVTSLGTVPTPSFSPGTGTYNSTQTVTISDTATAATIYYTIDGSTPTTASTAYTAPIMVSATETVKAIAVQNGYTNSAVAVAVYTFTPNFTLALNQSSVIVTYGLSAQVEATVQPEFGFTGTVTLACSGLPAGATCSFSPATLTPSTSAPTAALQSTLTVTAPATSASLQQKGINPMLPGGATFAAALCLIGLRKRRRLQVMLMMVFGMVGMAALSGCGSSSPKPPAIVTSTVTITATSGSLVQSLPLTFTEQ